MEVEIAQLFYEMNHMILPNSLNTAEIKKAKGSIDLRSVICQKLSQDPTRYEYTDEPGNPTYNEILMNVYNKNRRFVTYTGPSRIIKLNDGMYVSEDGNRLLNYLYTPLDVSNIIPKMKFKLHNEKDYILINCSATKTLNELSIAFNIDMADENAPELIDKLKTTNFVTYGDGNIVAPFVIENVGLADGTIVVHVFHNNDGTALINWMKYCTFMFIRMFWSIVNTLRTQDEAYYSPGLGGQFPVDFFRALRGTIEAINDNVRPDRISINYLMTDLLMAYSKTHDGKLLPRRIGNVFGSYSNLEMFLIHFITLIGCFEDFHKIAQYNKKPREEKIKIGDMLMNLMKDSSGMNSMFQNNVEFARSALMSIKGFDDDNIGKVTDDIARHIANMRMYT
jgi:hypothetical protein